MLPARPLRIGALAFLLGGEGHGLLGPEESTADGAFRTRIGGGYGMLTLGRDFFPDRPGSLHPQCGLGAGAMTLRMDERGAPTFEDLFRARRISGSWQRTSFPAVAGAGGRIYSRSRGSRGRLTPGRSLIYGPFGPKLRR